MVKVIQERHLNPDSQEQLAPMLRQLRLAVMNQPGYITGETLTNSKDPNHQIVIGTFRSLKDWESWKKNKERNAINKNIRPLLSRAPKITVCNVYQWQAKQ
ncbi:MAG: antibiotic biosynthesis monooxygenase [Dehalococcoidia bacterium]|nr:antibiotic biosynthesis monooxygenase [Dehalococcoidia bacterium]MDZ4246704.1 antibiotic biosynthesis monooxygenase [Dehalococcoidia bacterium]